MSTAEFESSDNINYTLTMNRSNFFINVYDLNGRLKKVILNTEFNNGNIIGTGGFRGFFKDNDNNFYLARNIFGFSGYREFGVVYPIAANVEQAGTVVKFN